MGNPLVELQKLGQSPWHDNIRRGLLDSGKLQKMIADGDITGLTSNPTIFEQAMGQGNDYEKDLLALARAGKKADEIFDALAAEDIRRAADAFRPVFDRTQGADGYVSIEVLPKLAADTAGSVTEAKRLWALVDRPNLMVKIPATVQGVPAVEQCIAAGLNINITLIFSLDRYNAVMEAYLAGLEQRVKAGQDISKIASVASFFVSRVDSAVDKQLEAKGAKGEALMGKAAIANAKLAYRDFLKKFSSPRFQALAKKGARKQRPLWASTSTKNPKYPDVYYVEALIGPDTVDTLPPATIDAYRDHGKPKVTLTQGLEEAVQVIKQLKELGIDLDAVIAKLEQDGVASFAKSVESLLSTVETKRATLIKKAG